MTRSSTSSTVPPKKAQPQKLKAPPAKVLTKVYDIGNGRDIHEYDDNTMEYFPSSEYDSIVNPRVQREDLTSPIRDTPETINSDAPAMLSFPTDFVNCMDPNLAIGTTIDIDELTFKMRKDKCLDEAEEAYNLDHDIEA